MAIRSSVWTKLAAVGVSIATMIACSSSSSDSAASPEESFCGARADAYAKCTGSGGSQSSCGSTIGAECTKVAALLNPSVLGAATTCLQSHACGTDPLTCLGSSLSSLTPSGGQSKLVDSYCSKCSSVPEDACKTAFFGVAGKPGIGIALLPFGDAPLAAVEDACTSNPLGMTACQAAFSSCLTATATKVLATSISPDAVTCLLTGIKDGLTSAASGTDGGSTTSDDGGPSTTDSGCTDCNPPPPCGPDNCAGCCDGSGQCQSGSASSACGAGGGTCSPCGGTTACSAGQCIETSCKATCTSGCCTAMGCQPGNALMACGTGGNACAACGNGRTCNAGACALSGTSTWDVVLVSAVIPAVNASGGSWDIFGGLPDPYADATSGATTGSVPYISDTLTPTWSATILSNVSATQLKSQLSIHLLDYDIAFNDSIGTCNIAVSDAFFDGTLRTAMCPASSASEVAFTLSYRIKAH